MPKFEANMNYIPPIPPSSMKQCNKSATVKFQMKLPLTTTTRKQSRSGETPFLLYWRSFRHFTEIRNCRLQTPFSLEKSKICRLGKR